MRSLIVRLEKRKAHVGRRKLKSKLDTEVEKNAPFKGFWFHPIKPKEGSDDISEL